jgi:hypothetical protein
MPLPDLAVLAEGDLPAGQHWVLKGGGTRADFCTFLETIYPDGHRDEGGMGGPPLSAGSLMNTYTGGSDRGLRRVLVRADPRVARVCAQLGNGDLFDLSLVAVRPDLGLVFFIALLPPSAALASVVAIGEDGQVLEPQDLSRHEASWQHFRRQHGHPQA